MNIDCYSDVILMIFLPKFCVTIAGISGGNINTLCGLFLWFIFGDACTSYYLREECLCFDYVHAHPAVGGMVFPGKCRHFGNLFCF